ncbi:tetratricopeptide repeat protein [Streptomyces sp. NPDC056486]|uniref:tetratricopeptide repeat protein n=1 Tax=Streptomyces sp. NPDC056486 TaxID=3345835 RepID=UPI0036C58A9E
MDGKDDVFAALRQLAEFRRTVLNGSVSERRLARIANVSPTTVGHWLRGNQFPQSIDGILRIVQAVRETAIDLEISLGAYADLLSDDKWRTLHRAEAARRSRAVAVAQERKIGQNALSEHNAARVRELPDPPRPIQSWTAKQLGVHPAVTEAQEAASDFTLPPYVQRSHDAELLRAVLKAKECREPQLIVIRGGSCTGKTRSAYEAVRAAVPDWHLIFPKNEASLLAAVDVGAAERNTIIWLNDAHQFLLRDRGEDVAMSLRRLLETGGPLVIVATFWTLHHRLISSGKIDPGGADKYSQVRELLKQGVLIDVPSSFSASDQHQLRKIAAMDRSLRLVAQSGSNSVTQYLAAAPDLLSHYDAADGVDALSGRAVITAAMDARRLGMSGPIPTAFLKAAATGYMDSELRGACHSETWFENALSYAREEIKGVTSAFVPVPHPTDIGALPDVVGLADYLDHYGQISRRFELPPESFWESAADLHSIEGVLEIAKAAHERNRSRHACALYREAGRRGNVTALRWVAYLRGEAGHSDESNELLWQAAEQGSTWALRDLARAKAKLQDFAEAERIAREGLEKGENPVSLWEVAQMRLDAGDREGGRSLLREAADGGLIDATADLLRLALEDGDEDSAEDLLSEIAESDDADMMTEIAESMKDKGDIKSAEWIFCRAATMGDLWAFGAIGVMRKESGRRAEAREILIKVVEAGLSHFLIDLGEMSEEEGNLLEAEAVYILATRNDRWEAPFRLARLYDATQRSEEAKDLVMLYAESGNFSPLMDLARHREQVGNVEGADLLCNLAIDFGNTVALSRLARRHEETGDLVAAEECALRSANAGDMYTLRQMAQNHIAEEKWRRIRMYGLELDGSPSEPW